MSAAPARLHLLFLILFFHLFTTVLASTFIPFAVPRPDLAPRTKFELNNATGTPQVFNPTTEQLIPQGSATDGGGTGFSPAEMIWVAFCFLVGIPMTLAGIRGWRFTTGVGIGLSAAVCCTYLSHMHDD